MSELEKNLYKRVTVPANVRAPRSGRAYRGFSTASLSNTGFSLYDHELIKQDLINHFHIRQGEKLSDPSFGCIIWDLLFEPFTPTIQEAIIENVTSIINFDSRVQVNEVIVDTYEQGISIDCSVTFLNYNLSEQLRFKFDQKNGLL
tara:strand:+ start:127 stop:564 length:438 start_codon:yes stop_codon:yes gene_type:complete